MKKHYHNNQDATLFLRRHHLLVKSRLQNLCIWWHRNPDRQQQARVEGSTKKFITAITMMMKTTWNNTIVRVVIVSCFLWMLFFPLYGGSSGGKEWFGLLASHFFHDKKGGVPVIMLAIPLLLAASTSSLFTTTTTVGPYHHLRGASTTVTILQYCPTSMQYFCGWVSATWQRGDFKFEPFAIVFLFLPSLIYLTSAMYRHLHGKSYDASKQAMEIGNSFGMMAVLATSILLVPVARQGPLWHSLGWNPSQAIRLHIWSGRIVVVGTLLHGVIHIFRWVFFEKESFLHNIIPPTLCWTIQVDVQDCDSVRPHCHCYDIFRNLSGIVSCMAMLGMGVTSLHSIRRRLYHIFYMSHILLAPTVVLAMSMHYNRTILYFAPSILYYVASSFPVLVESRKKISDDGAIKILSVTPISSDCNFPGASDKNEDYDDNNKRQSRQSPLRRPCVSLTFEVTNAAWHRYSPGMYAHLLARHISNLSHPFSVNRVISSNPKAPLDLEGNLDDNTTESRQLRIIFRVSGPFTKQLATCLKSTITDVALSPRIKIHGYHGTSDRVAQVLQHDVVLIIAGGIGITAYLSLLEDLTSILIDSSQREQVSNAMEPLPQSLITKKITLHWYCREPELVNFIRKEYLEPLLRLAAASVSSPNTRTFCLELIVHLTGDNNFWNEEKDEGMMNSRPIAPYTDTVHHTGATNSQEDKSDARDQIIGMEESDDTSAPSFEKGSGGASFSPSRFSVASNITGNVGKFFTFSAIAWCGLCIIWYFYSNVQQSKQVSQRAYAPLAIVFLGIVVSYLADAVPERFFASKDDNGAMGVECRHHEGKWWDQVKKEEDDTYDDSRSQTQGHEETPSFSIEMPSLHHRDHKTHGESDNTGVKQPLKQLVTLQVLNGRPPVRDILRSVADADRPGVFCCAPSSLTSEIYHGTHTMCPVRGVRGRSSSMAFYNEAFEI